MQNVVCKAAMTVRVSLIQYHFAECIVEIGPFEQQMADSTSNECFRRAARLELELITNLIYQNVQAGQCASHE